MSTLTEDQTQLYDFMSELSERCYFAGWVDGTEFRLWEFMTDPQDNGDWGHSSIPNDARQELKRLSERVGGWTYFGDDGPTFEPATKWLRTFAAWQAGCARK